MRRLASVFLSAFVVASVGVASVGVAPVSGDATRERQIGREFDQSLDESARFLDMGITLSVVVRDELHGTQIVEGVPPMRVAAQHRLGGMVDLWGENNGGVPYICGPSANPVSWVCSQAQEPLILHRDESPVWSLAQGSEGSGKTYALVMWVALRVLEHLGHEREIGVTAPVARRMEHVRKAIKRTWPASWCRWKEAKREYHFHAGPIVALASAHQSRKDEGSPIQGANWVAHAGDELQDHFDKEGDIVMRGRSAPDGVYKRFNTSTAKDMPSWRTFRETVQASPVWTFSLMLGTENPLVPPQHWARLIAGGMSRREYQRRVLALDVGPEAQVYHCWSRKLEDGTPGNLRPIPLGAINVTAETLAAYGKNIGVLVGHDPGTRQHVSEFLQAFRFPADVRRGDMRPRWFVVDEITTTDSTAHAHAQQVLKRLRTKWFCNTLDRKGLPDVDAQQVLVRIDPHTRSGDEHPGRDHYAVWSSLGMKARAAAYKPGSTEPATIKRMSRIDMINTLLCAVTATDLSVRRLFVACDDTGVIAAPKLVAAFESMEKDAAGRAEHEKKDENDLSHWPCSVGYGLWQLEHQRMGQAAA